MLDHSAVSQDHLPDASGDSLADSIQLLESRLHRGWEVISTAEHRGEPTDVLFDHFLDLLRQYERLFSIAHG